MDKFCKSQFILLTVLCITPLGVHAGEILSARKHAEIRLLLSDDAFDLKMAAKSLQRRTMQDVELSDMLAEKLWQRCSTINTDKDDTAAWMSKGIAASKQGKYLNVIEHCMNKLTHANTVKHLNLAKSQMMGGDANTFEPGKVAWDKYQSLAKLGPKKQQQALTAHFGNLKYGTPLEEIYQQFGMPDEVKGANVRLGKVGHIVRVSRSADVLSFKYNGHGTVHFYSLKDDNTWTVFKGASEKNLYWHDKDNAFIDINKYMAETTGSELRAFVKELILKTKYKISIEKNVLAAMANRLTSSVDEQDSDTLKAFYYMCRILAISKDGQFYPALAKVAEQATDPKLKTYAEKYARKLEMYASNTKTEDT